MTFHETQGQSADPLRAIFDAGKAAHPGHVVGFVIGDFVEFLFEDASTVAGALGLALIARRRVAGLPLVPMAGFPVGRWADYVARLAAGGHQVAVVTDPERLTASPPSLAPRDAAAPPPTHGLEATAKALGAAWARADLYDRRSLDRQLPHEEREHASAEFEAATAEAHKLEVAAPALPVTNDREACISAALIVEHLRSIGPVGLEGDDGVLPLLERTRALAEQLALYLLDKDGHDPAELGVADYTSMLIRGRSA